MKNYDFFANALMFFPKKHAGFYIFFLLSLFTLSLHGNNNSNTSSSSECLSVAEYYVYTNEPTAVKQLQSCEASFRKYELLTIFYFNNKDYREATKAFIEYREFVLKDIVRPAYPIYLIALKSFIAIDNDKVAYVLYNEMRNKWPEAPEYEYTYATYLLGLIPSMKRYNSEYYKAVCPDIRSMLKTAKKKNDALTIPENFKSFCGEW